MIQRKHFSLIEIVAVIAIVGIVLTVATVAMRRDSSTAKFEQAAREFQAFVARTRLQAMELGRDRAIIYITADRVFVSGDPQEEISDSGVETTPIEVPEDYRYYDPDDDEEVVFDDAPAVKLAKLSWTLPENYEFAATEFSSDLVQVDEVEIFRFFPDGAGSGRRRFTMQHKGTKKIMDISPLTGLLRTTEEAVQ